MDWFAKEILQGAVDGLRTVHQEEPITPEVLFHDAWIKPIPGVGDVQGPLSEHYKILKAEWEAEKAERAAELARVRDLARADGMRPLLRQVERRIARPLTDAERTSLSACFDLVGPERLGDVVLDLPPDALAAWITAPDAH